jgi:hypothetical protein
MNKKSDNKINNITNEFVDKNNKNDRNDLPPAIISTPVEKPAGVISTGAPAIGIINLSDLTLTQDFENQIGVTKVLTTVPVRKPTRFDWVRVHPDPAWRLDVGVLDIKEDNELYLVHNSIVPEVAGEITGKTLFTVANRQGDISLWPVNISSDGRTNDWNRSALEAAQHGMKRWIQVRSNTKIGAYEVYFPKGVLPEPEWPVDINFAGVLNIAFKDRYITDSNHPVLRRMRGEI